MLLFITEEVTIPEQGTVFQYISCYSLSRSQTSSMPFISVSIHLMLLFISERLHFFIIGFLFQYISCYSLSWEEPTTMTIKEMFQYISCYSLSADCKRQEEERKRFQYISCYSLSRKWQLILKMENSFNTSHVTLYRYAPQT